MKKDLEKKELIGEVAPEQIAGWKNLHKEIYALKVGGHICYLRKPNRTELAAASATYSKNHIAYNEFILTSTWLGGSDEIKTNDALFFGACIQLPELIEIKESELVKL